MTADSVDLGSGLEDLDVPDEPDEAELSDIGEGRYLYRVVRVGDDLDFGTSGVDDEPVSVVDADGIGAVIHTCDRIYDSADLTEVRRWLVRHQTVVDEAGDTFGTPVPLQFVKIADDGETLCRLTLLAHEDGETAVSSVLDDVAAAPGLEVRFSGRWPPYTFAPEIGNEGT